MQPLRFDQIWFEATHTFLPLGREYFEKYIDDQLVLKLANEEDVEKAGSRMANHQLSCYHWHQLTTDWYEPLAIFRP